MKNFFRKILIVLSILVISGFLLFLFRENILRGFGNFLIVADSPVRVDAAFVLSGVADERSRKAAELYELDYFPRIVTTGEVKSGDAAILGKDLDGAALTAIALEKLGVDRGSITELHRGTGTFEEAEAILGFAKAQGFKRIIIITSKFHTRRTRSVFKKRFAGQDIEVFVAGAEPLSYQIETWWEYEGSLVFVFDEYVKSIYYTLRY